MPTAVLAASKRASSAAAERLEYYRAYCPDVPADAVPLLTPKYEARVNPAKKEAPRPKPVCSSWNAGFWRPYASASSSHSAN